MRKYNYEPYGTDIPVTGTWTTTTPMKFAGGEADATQRDPLNQADDMRQANRYAYAEDDPVNVTDLTGTCTLCEVAEIGGEAIAITGLAVATGATGGVATLALGTAVAGFGICAGPSSVGGVVVALPIVVEPGEA